MLSITSQHTNERTNECGFEVLDWLDWMDGWIGWLVGLAGWTGLDGLVGLDWLDDLFGGQVPILTREVEGM